MKENALLQHSVAVIILLYLDFKIVFGSIWLLWRKSMVGGAGYFLLWYKVFTILPTPSVMDHLYQFHLKSRLKSPKGHSKQGASLWVQLFIFKQREFVIKVTLIFKSDCSKLEDNLSFTNSSIIWTNHKNSKYSMKLSQNCLWRSKQILSVALLAGTL